MEFKAFIKVGRLVDFDLISVGEIYVTKDLEGFYVKTGQRESMHIETKKISYGKVEEKYKVYKTKITLY